MIRRNRQHRHILSRLWDGLDAAVDAQPAADPGGAEIRQLPAAVDNLVSDLVNEFGQAPLLESGVVVADDGGEVRLAPRLGIGSTLFMILSDDPDGLPFDMLRGDRLLLGSESLTAAAVHDWRIRERLRNTDGALLLVPTLADAAVCSSLGLAAVPCEQVERLSAPEMRRIATLLRPAEHVPLPPSFSTDDFESDAHSPLPVAVATNAVVVDADAISTPAVNLVVVDDAEDGLDVIGVSTDAAPLRDLFIAGWSFVFNRHAMEDRTQACITHLANAERYLPIDLSNIAVWVPSPSDAERIGYCAALQDNEAVRMAVMESIDTACYRLSAAISAAAAVERGAGNLAETRSAFWHGIGDPHASAGERDNLRLEFEKALTREVCDPLIAAGLSHRDPVTGALYFEFANMMAMSQLQAPFLQDDLLRASARSDSPKDRANLERNLRSRMRMVSGLVAISREIHR